MCVNVHTPPYVLILDGSRWTEIACKKKGFFQDFLYNEKKKSDSLV